MKQTGFNGRLLWRKILTGLSLGAVAITFQACYGPPPAPLTLSGTVKSADTKEPISGIGISYDNEYYNSLPEDDRYLAFSDSDGSFLLYVGGWDFTLLFKDIDGEENGEFLEKTVEWNYKNGRLNIELERVR
jgi:hypothetical protein